MDNFKFNFLSWGQLESLSLDKFFLPLLKILPCYEGFLVTLFLPLLLECSAEIILIYLTSPKYFVSALSTMAFSASFAVVHAVTVQAR